jgi:uncharacterized protein (DUF2147 family)
MRFNCFVFTIATVVVGSLPMTSTADGATAIIGAWLVEERTGKIEIFRCKETFCGKLVWIKPSAEQPNPEEIRDIHNPNPNKRSRKVLGSTILWGLTYDNDDHRWEDGQIYDNRTGKTYSCQVTLASGGQKLLLRGFVGISLLGKTTTWTRLK